MAAYLILSIHGCGRVYFLDKLVAGTKRFPRDTSSQLGNIDPLRRELAALGFMQREFGCNQEQSRPTL